MVLAAVECDAPEGVVGLSVSAAVEAVASGTSGGGGDGCDAGEAGEGGFVVESVGVAAGGDEELRGGVRADVVDGEEFGRDLAGELGDGVVGGADFLGELGPAAGQPGEGSLGRGEGGVVGGVGPPPGEPGDQLGQGQAS